MDIKGKKSALWTPADMPKLTTFLAAAEAAVDPSGHFVGGSLTLADIAMFEVLTTLEEIAPTVLDDFPTLKAFQRSFAASPNVAAYMASPRRIPITFNESGPNKGLPGYAFKVPVSSDVYGTLWAGPSA